MVRRRGGEGEETVLLPLEEVIICTPILFGIIRRKGNAECLFLFSFTENYVVHHKLTILFMPREVINEKVQLKLSMEWTYLSNLPKMEGAKNLMWKYLVILSYLLSLQMYSPKVIIYVPSSFPSNSHSTLDFLFLHLFRSK